MLNLHRIFEMQHACSMSGRLGVFSWAASARAQAGARQHTVDTAWGSRSNLGVTHATRHGDEPLKQHGLSKPQQDSAPAASAVGGTPAARQQQNQGSSSFQQQLQSEKQLDAVEDPLLSNMRHSFASRHPSWQHRQQPKQHHSRGRQQQQQRPRASTTPAGAVSKQTRSSRFAQYSTYHALMTALQQQQQAAVGSTSEQHEQPSSLQLNAADTLSLIEQLAFIGSSNGSRFGSMVGGSSSFIEDQALQQLLPVAYDVLRQHASSNSLNPGSSSGTAGMRPRELLCCISCLASLKYSMPVQLAELLEQVPAGGRAGTSGLGMQQLASLITNLARAGVRPSNAWLVAFMQEAQAKFHAANLAQLSQLLSGLVKMGVKPAASWLDSMQEQAVQCLVEQAVRVQVTAGQLQQQQQEQEQQVGLASAGAAATTAGGVSSSGNAGRQQHRSNNSSSSNRRTVAGCQLHDVAQLLCALAEAKHNPKPQLAAALWGATVTSLAAADTASLVELLGALGELQLVPPVTWMRQYYGSTYGALRSGQYKPWQLASSVAAMGKLAQAGLHACLDNEQQQQQMKQDPDASTAGGISSSSSRLTESSADVSCPQWVATALQDVHRQLSLYAARDLAALLAGLAALQLPLAASQVAAICDEVKHKLSRMNTAGLATLLAAVVELEQQQQLGSEQQQRFVLFTEDWIRAFLQETAAKLPVFPASDLAAVLRALQASTIKPSKLWLEAAAAQLHSKLTVLDPAGVVHVLDALLSMGYVPDQSWVASAVTALEARVVELHGWELQVMLQSLIAVGAAPSSMLLDSAHWVVLQLAQQGLEQQEESSSSGYADTCQQLLEQLESRIGTTATIQVWHDSIV